MTSPSATRSQIRAQVASIHKKHPDARAIGIKSDRRWQGSEKEIVEDREFRFAQCDSVLQVREALLSSGAELPLVVVTDLEGSQLGDDVLARFVRSRLYQIRPWNIVLEYFSAIKLDPSFRGQRWLAEALLQNVPSGGYPAVSSGVLDEETVWGVVLRNHLGFKVVRPDAQDLLEWTTDDNRIAVYQTASPEMRAGVQKWISRSAGGVADLIFRCIEGGFAQDVIPLGLVCETVVDNAGGASIREAAVRLERFTGNRPIPNESARNWAGAACNVIDKFDKEGQRNLTQLVLERADQILKELHVEQFSYLSRYSLAGFELRLDRYGKRLQAALDSELRSLPNDLVELAEDVLQHRQSDIEMGRAMRVRMSLRLVKWMASDSEATATSFELAARAYIRSSGFVDWARYHLFTGETVTSLSKAYSRLVVAAADKRELESGRFGELLVNWTASGSPGDSIIRIEEVLANIVAKIGQSERVLLVVLDGMSWAAQREILEDAIDKGWLEFGPIDGEWPRPVIAALPSVTQFSRTSLLCGDLRSGTSVDEISGFKNNPALTQISRSTHPPVLFHKGTLTESTGRNLAPEVRDEIASEKRQVVGVVVNAIDDHLAKGSQIEVPWILRHIPVLEQLLSVGREAGRTVVLTSDHGHIIEWESTYRGADSGERYRSNDGNPLEGELIVRGSRVILSEDHAIIAPWSEGIRYAAKKHGYHGGISPQECIVPLTVLSRWGKTLGGWQPQPTFYPEWWDVAGAPLPRNVDLSFSQMPVVTPIPVEESLPLFAIAEKEEIGEKVDWVEVLINSGIFANQVRLAGPMVPKPELITTFLKALDERGGRMLKKVLAQKIGQPELRINGIIAAMRRVLNVDGYGVLSVDEASQTVMLNLDLLKVQFGLEL